MRIHAGPAFALARIQENISEESFPHISQILEGIHIGANTRRACIRTSANTGKIPGKMFMYCFHVRGHVAWEKNPHIAGDRLFSGRCKGHTHKEHREKVLRVMNFRVFSGYFQGVSGYLQ